MMSGVVDLAASTPHDPFRWIGGHILAIIQQTRIHTDPTPNRHRFRCSQLSVQAELVEVMLDLVLVLEQPISARLVEQRLADDLAGGLAVDVEKGLVVQVVNFDHCGVEPDRVDDSQVVDLVLRNHPGADRVEDAVRDRRLHGSHQDVGIFFVLHGDIAHHDGGRANLDIAAQDGEGPGMTLDLVADQVRQGLADRTVQLADDDLGLGTQMILRAFDQCLSRPQ